MASVSSRPFGVTHAGETVTQYTLQNPGGLAVSVLDYGCIIRQIVVPARGGPVDVVLGHDALRPYEDAPRPYGGVWVARCPLPGQPGAPSEEFARRLFAVKVVGVSLLMEATSADGALKVAVRYALTPENALRMDYRVAAQTDLVLDLKDRLCFNLNGGGDILGQKLRLYAGKYLANGPDGRPAGGLLPAAGTPMDFAAGKPLGRDLNAGFATLRQAGGYDHLYAIDRGQGASQSICAWAASDQTGVSMKVYTTRPAVRLYTGNRLVQNAAPGKGGLPPARYGGFALQTCHFPAGLGGELPCGAVRAGKVFRASTTLRFFTGRQCGRL